MATLSAAQLLTLKNDIAANTNTVTIGGVSVQIKNAPVGADANFEIMKWYNGASTFVVWKSIVSIGAVGDNIVASELAGLTTANLQRLQTIGQFSPAGVNPSLSDRRAFFDDVFSGAGGALTRAKLLILWKRFATFGEKLYATGTGSDAVPGSLVVEGNLTTTNVGDARGAS